MSRRTPRGRGAPANPAGRFERLEIESLEPVPAKVPTQFLRDASRTVIARNDSPDVGFDASINPYRGCEHGCAYCYARPTHEYLGFSAGLDFETRIMVKQDAAELLERELGRPGLAAAGAGRQRGHRSLPAGRAPAGRSPAAVSRCWPAAATRWRW